MKTSIVRLQENVTELLICNDKLSGIVGGMFGADILAGQGVIHLSRQENFHYPSNIQLLKHLPRNSLDSKLHCGTMSESEL